MSNHTKGRAWARAVEVMLNGAGFHTHKRPLGEAGDDITARRGDLELSVEAKNHKSITLAAFLDQAEGNARSDQHAVVIAHRPGRASAEDGYVVMSAAGFMALLDEAMS